MHQAGCSGTRPRERYDEDPNLLTCTCLWNDLSVNLLLANPDDAGSLIWWEATPLRRRFSRYVPMGTVMTLDALGARRGGTGGAQGARGGSDGMSA